MKEVSVPSILIAVTLLSVFVTAEAQQPGKIFRIGFLDPSTASGSEVLVNALRQAMSRL